MIFPWKHRRISCFKKATLMYLCPNTCKSQTTHGECDLVKAAEEWPVHPRVSVAEVMGWEAGRDGWIWICKSPSGQWHRKAAPLSALESVCLLLQVWNFREGVTLSVGPKKLTFLFPILKCFLLKDHWYIGKMLRAKLRNPRADYEDNWLKSSWIQSTVARVRDWENHCQWGDHGPVFIWK